MFLSTQQTYGVGPLIRNTAAEVCDLCDGEIFSRSQQHQFIIYQIKYEL